MKRSYILLGVIAAVFHLSEGAPLRLNKRAAFYIANETACVVDNTVYFNGDPIPTDDPCEACRCRPPGFACVLKECEVKPGCRAVRRAGHCCPEYICGCEHNGRMYRDGEEIRDTQNPCYNCVCQGSAIACAFVDCFFRVDCAPEYVQGQCCPRYDHCDPIESTTNFTSLGDEESNTQATLFVISTEVTQQTDSSSPSSNDEEVTDTKTEINSKESENGGTSSEEPEIPSAATEFNDEEVKTEGTQPLAERTNSAQNNEQVPTEQDAQEVPNANEKDNLTNEEDNLPVTSTEQEGSEFIESENRDEVKTENGLFKTGNENNEETNPDPAITIDSFTELEDKFTSEDSEISTEQPSSTVMVENSTTELESMGNASDTVTTDNNTAQPTTVLSADPSTDSEVVNSAAGNSKSFRFSDDDQYNSQENGQSQNPESSLNEEVKTSISTENTDNTEVPPENSTYNSPDSQEKNFNSTIVHNGSGELTTTTSKNENMSSENPNILVTDENMSSENENILTTNENMSSENENILTTNENMSTENENMPKENENMSSTDGDVSTDSDANEEITSNAPSETVETVTTVVQVREQTNQPADNTDMTNVYTVTPTDASQKLLLKALSDVISSAVDQMITQNTDTVPISETARSSTDSPTEVSPDVTTQDAQTEEHTQSVTEVQTSSNSSSQSTAADDVSKSSGDISKEPTTRNTYDVKAQETNETSKTDLQSTTQMENA